MSIHGRTETVFNQRSRINWLTVEHFRKFVAFYWAIYGEQRDDFHGWGNFRRKIDQVWGESCARLLAGCTNICYEWLRSVGWPLTEA